MTDQIWMSLVKAMRFGEDLQERREFATVFSGKAMVRSRALLKDLCTCFKNSKAVSVVGIE